MCGISGFFGKGDQDALEAMANALSHRGPDEAGYYRDSSNPIYLSHRRLVIRDPKGGRQPMTTADGLIAITYNGEIYNAKELRQELEAKGHVFKSSHSDTEVILYAYREWQEACVQRFNGMWAFAIFDKTRRRLFLSRDRFGQKPLYYTFQSGIFAFASEIKAFKKHPHLSLSLSFKSQQKYHAYGYLPGNLSIYERVFKLPGGCNLIFEVKDESVRTNQYWTYEIEPDHTRNESYWIETLRELLGQSVHRRLVSDVPIGIFLSGGLDSSAIAVFAKQKMQPDLFKSYSIGFEDLTFDETSYAKQVSQFLGSKHSTVTFSHKHLEAIFKDLLCGLDEPLSDSSLLSYYLLCRFAREKVTVALGGDAGDELFAGYDTHKALIFAKAMTHMLPKPFHQAVLHMVSFLPVSHSYMTLRFKLEQFLKILGHPSSHWNPLWLGPLAPQEIEQVTGSPIKIEELYSEAIDLWDKSSHKNLLDRSLEFYGKLFLQDQILVKADRMSMLNSLEVRTPLLDIDLINCVRKIPSRFKLKGNHGKYIFKKAMEPFLPRNIIWRKKVGFSAPLGQWLLDDHITFKENISWSASAKQLINSSLNSHKSRRVDRRLFLWNTYLFGEWALRGEQKALSA